MIRQNSQGIISIPVTELSNMIVYTDRNWVFNKVNVIPEVLENIKAIILKINHILDWTLNVISNESEDDRNCVLETDKKNGISFNEDNYKLSTQSAAKFILEKLKSTKCYFIWGNLVSNDINKLWLETINISNDLLIDKPDLLEWELPILFWRPLFAIAARFDTEQNIKNNIWWDIAFQNAKYLLEKYWSKIVFCHTKQNCERVTEKWKHREINLWYYFEELVKIFSLEIWRDIFDLWKWRYSNWEFFDMALWIKNSEEYEKVLWIWDMFTDIEHTLINWWTWILVNSWDEVIDDSIIEKIQKFKDRVFLISDLSKLQIIIK